MIEIIKKKNKAFRISIKVCKDATPGSWGSHQLLLQELRRSDVDYGIRGFGPGNPAYDQMKFNTDWLKLMESKYGKLKCEYCGKPNLKIYEWYEDNDIRIMATTDHFHPQKSHPQLQKETKNFVVACHSCNNNKKAKPGNKSAIKFPYPEERIF